MRSTLLALLASSLLVKDAAAFPFGKRDLFVVQDNVVVTEVVTVTAEADGSYVTGTPVAVGTATIPGSPVLTSTGEQAAQTSTVIEAVTTSEAAVTPPAVVEPTTTSTTPVAVAPTTTAEAETTTAQAQTTPAKVVETTTSAVAVPTTSAAPAATTTAATVVANTSDKRGLAFNDASLLSGFVGSGSKVSWAYNWGDSSSGIPSGVEYVPMLWGLGSHTDGWTSAATSAIASGSTHLVGFNEPDLGSQSNLTPAEAATGWATYMQPFAGKVQLGSPAVTNGGSPMGVTWLQNFISECKGCTIDFICLHWYNGGTAQDFISYVQNAHTTTGLPVWVTEFEAPGNSDAEDIAFLNTVMTWLDAQSFVQRYAYFGVFDGTLISSGKTLSDIGTAYAYGS